jgi:hypothetical protein
VPIWKWSADKKVSAKSIYVAYGAKNYSELKILLMVFPTKEHGRLKFMRKSKSLCGLFSKSYCEQR